MTFGSFWQRQQNEVSRVAYYPRLEASPRFARKRDTTRSWAQASLDGASASNSRAEQFAQVTGSSPRSVLARIEFLCDLSRLTDFLNQDKSIILGNRLGPSVAIDLVAGSVDEPSRI
jgi:hypothetical protein